jgi:ATP-binding cassette subfamily C protein
VRLNVDHFSAHPDSAIIAALEKVGLWATLAEREGGLDAELRPDALSGGQLQLLGLARALLGGARWY